MTPRRRKTPTALATAAFFFVLGAALPQGVPPSSPSDMAAAARSLLATLRPEIRAQAVLPFDSGERRNWHYVPRPRKGISLKAMNAAEQAAARSLLAAGLSGRGHQKVTGIVELEAILRELELLGGWRRDPGLYFLTIFGDPSDAAPWGWRFEGHHLSLNFSSITGDLVAVTPAFFGANPARVPEGPRAGWRVLAVEEDLARELLASLDARQRARAVFAVRAPADIILGPGRREVPRPAGLAFSAMTPPQRDRLLRLVGEYLGNARADVAAREWSRIRRAGLDAVRFGWAGGSEPGQGHYYRIQGPTFLIEFDNTQDGANHVHTVWRDLEEDFGGDLLRRHYEESPHHRNRVARR